MRQTILIWDAPVRERLDEMIPISQEVKEGAMRMCNLSEGIFNDGFESGKETGIKIGTENGIRIGTEAGIKTGTINMIRKMLAYGIPSQDIIAKFGCSEEDLAAAQAEAPKAEN